VKHGERFNGRDTRKRHLAKAGFTPLVAPPGWSRTLQTHRICSDERYLFSAALPFSAEWRGSAGFRRSD
jgi:hypothetical protein